MVPSERDGGEEGAEGLVFTYSISCTQFLECYKSEDFQITSFLTKRIMPTLLFGSSQLYI